MTLRSLAPGGLIATIALLPLLTRPAGAVQTLRYRTDPHELGRGAPHLGRWIPDLEFADARGQTSRLSEVAGEKGLVIAMRDPDCPLSKRYTPRLKQLEQGLADRGLGLLYVGNHDLDLATRDVETFGLGATYAVDPESSIARELRAQTSTEVFVLDARRTLVYRGMIDDQYGLGFIKPAVERPYLMQAVAAVQAGEIVEVPATVAQGCLLELGEGQEPAREVTYHNRISRIVQSKCQGCHRPGAVGPFTLMTYKDVARRKRMLKWVIEDEIMPPWFAEEESGPWANDARLSEAEKQDLLGWLAEGAPEGDRDDGPLPRKWPAGWTIGEPDLVVPIPEPITVPAEGVVDYQYVYTKLDLTEDRWVRAVEIRAGAPEVVHHVLVFVEVPPSRQAVDGDPRAAQGRQEGVDGYFASLVPGQQGLRFPEGSGKLLPAGSWLKFQLHYTPNGKPTVDRSEVAFIFADGPLDTQVQTNAAYNTQFAIPPGAFDYEVFGEYRFRENATLISLFPHLHLRGTRFRYDLIYPDGHQVSLLELPFYDFNWQLNYELEEPLDVPRGTRLRATGWYDNTKENPANPDPDSWVRFGDQTFEEMMIGYVNWVPTSSLPVEASAPMDGPVDGPMERKAEGAGGQ